MSRSARVAQGIDLKASGNQTARPPLQLPVVGHYLEAWRPVVILNRKDMATGLVGGTEEPDRRVQRVLTFLTRDWHRHGRPRFVQWTTT
jgi:hypothetical protein